MTGDVQKILKRIKTLVCIRHKYRISLHVKEYIDQNLSSYEDIEYCILNARTINGIAKDEKRTAIDGMIYTIRGQSRDGSNFYTTGKFLYDESRQTFYYFITAHKIYE